MNNPKKPEIPKTGVHSPLGQQLKSVPLFEFVEVSSVDSGSFWSSVIDSSVKDSVVSPDSDEFSPDEPDSVVSSVSSIVVSAELPLVDSSELVSVVLISVVSDEFPSVTSVVGLASVVSVDSEYAEDSAGLPSVFPSDVFSSVVVSAAFVSVESELAISVVSEVLDSSVLLDVNSSVLLDVNSVVASDVLPTDVVLSVVASTVLISVDSELTDSTVLVSVDSGAKVVVFPSKTMVDSAAVESPVINSTVLVSV